MTLPGCVGFGSASRRLQHFVFRRGPGSRLPAFAQDLAPPRDAGGYRRAPAQENGVPSISRKRLLNVRVFLVSCYWCGGVASASGEYVGVVSLGVCGP